MTRLNVREGTLPLRSKITWAALATLIPIAAALIGYGVSWGQFRSEHEDLKARVLKIEDRQEVDSKTRSDQYSEILSRLVMLQTQMVNVQEEQRHQRETIERRLPR